MNQSSWTLRQVPFSSSPEILIVMACHGMSRHVQKNMVGLSILHDQCKGAEQRRQANWQVWYGVVQNTKYRGLLRSSWSFLTLFFNLLKLALVWCLVRFCIATTKTHNCTQLNTQLNAHQSLVYAILCILHYIVCIACPPEHGCCKHFV